MLYNEQSGLRELTDMDHQIYFRQMQDEAFGVLGQQKLKSASVLVSRVGGLGGTVAMQLARAGVGKLIIAHGGVVEAEKLNRMHLAFYEDLGRVRADVLEETLKKINPEIEVVKEADDIHGENAERLVSQADLIVDGAPVFSERYHMNEQAVKQNKPMVMAGMYGMEGYMSNIIPGETPCLKCIYPKQPDYWEEKCFPVLCPSSVLIAAFAAAEAIKIITGFGEVLKNKLLFYDLSRNQVKYLKIGRKSDCPVCSAIH